MKFKFKTTSAEVRAFSADQDISLNTSRDILHEREMIAACKHAGRNDDTKLLAGVLIEVIQRLE